MSKPILDAVLAAAGKYHDVDFARLELLKLLAEHPRVRTRVAEDYRDTDAIGAARFLVTYTCDDGSLVEGTVDLAYETGEGLTVIDFKTDHPVDLIRAGGQKNHRYGQDLSDLFA